MHTRVHMHVYLPMHLPMHVHVHAGAHYELKDKAGLDCLGGRSVEDMLRVCLTICSLVDFNGIGSVDGRCVGVNYDEHGDKGHCHLQSSAMLLAASNPKCAGQTDSLEQGGLCMSVPRLTPRGICAELGSPQWCGLTNYLAFFSFFNGDLGPHRGRLCGYGTGWDEKTQAHLTPAPHSNQTSLLPSPLPPRHHLTLTLGLALPLTLPLDP